MIGKKIAHYRIEAELGRGGMGVVYRAQDERLHRPVALKLLPEDATGHAERRARILAEARAASALNHPGITTIYEVGEDGDLLFIVMEMVSGQTLRQKLVAGPLEPHELTVLGGQVAEALAAAHARGILHGDIKPENIIVQEDRRVKLLDFGIARQIAEETATATLTQPDAIQVSYISGTLAYMSPEQLRGQAVDARSDLYSFGVVLYEMCAGRRPFPGPSATALAAQMLHEDPAPLDTAALPSGLVRVVHRLLEKHPDARPRSALEVQADLSNVIRDIELGPALRTAVAGKRAVAVLPFKLLTPNAEDEYLSVALADAIINQLGASGELLVRPVSTVMRYAKQVVDPLLAAKELNVQVIVDGSVQKAGTRLRVHAQAWNAADGMSLLSTKQDGDITELFALQDELATRLAVTLGSTKPLAAAEPAEPPTRNARAYELFLRATERLARLNRWDMGTAIEMLEQAVTLDPRFADAWARLAEAYVLMGGTWEPHPRWLRRADQAIRRALALDRRNAEAQCARGRLLWTPARGFQNRPALRALGEALRINPGCHAARIWQCLIFMHLGLLGEAKRGLLEALATHPDDAFTLVFAGQTALYRGDYAEADEYQTRALSVDPANIWANIFAPISPLYAGRLARAEEKIRAAQQVFQDDPWMASCEALLWARRGEKRKAEALLRRSLRPGKAFLHTHHLWHHAAATYAELGKPAPAVALLKRASTHGLPNYPAFRDDPHFQSLHACKPFQQFLRKLKKEWESYRHEFGAPATEQ